MIKSYLLKREERKLEIIDAHAHIYPNKIAEKATNAIGYFYDIKMEMPAGTTERLLEDGLMAGISKFVVHSCATKAVQVRSINEFLKQEIDTHDNFIGFMTLHQDLLEEQAKMEEQLKALLDEYQRKQFRYSIFSPFTRLFSVIKNHMILK